MNPVVRALWHIEHHFSQTLTLEEIAHAGGVSRFHMTRAFALATGFSVMRYVRGRRLTEAARALANGAPDILAVALEAGYRSHEAFTRAFGEQFGVAPEAVRAQGHLDSIALVEALVMNETLTTQQQAPRFEQGKPLLLAGLSERFDSKNPGGIPAQWQRFGAYIGHIPGQIGKVAYGVCYNSDDAGNMDYLCGVEVAEFSDVPKELTRLRIPEQRYAVFHYREHISAIRSAWNAIWSEWLPHSGREAADAPFFERYGEAFDPRTGNGGFELWIPLK